MAIITEGVTSTSEGFWMAPDRNIVPIPNGATPAESLRIFFSLLMKHYEDIRSFALEVYKEAGQLNDAFFDNLVDELTSSSWTLMYDGELVVDALTDKMVKRLKEPLRLLNLGDQQFLVQEYPDQEIGVATVNHFLRSNTARQLKTRISESISEKTYKELHNVSDIGRKERAQNVYVRPPKTVVDDYGNPVLLYNFKSQNSTTGKRQEGYVKFLSGEDEENSQVEVFCSCPDYKYRYAQTNWKDGSSPEPSDPKNKAFPIKTNPSGDIGMCKHLIAASKYIDGMDFI